MDKKCPFCGSTNYGKLVPPMGDSFAIGYASKKDGLLDAGMPVDLYGCANCHCVWMASDSFASHK